MRASQIFYTMEDFASFGIFDASWKLPRNPNLTLISCAYYLDTDNVFVNGWATIAVPTR